MKVFDLVIKRKYRGTYGSVIKNAKDVVKFFTDKMKIHESPSLEIHVVTIDSALYVTNVAKAGTDKALVTPADILRPVIIQGVRRYIVVIYQSMPRPIDMMGEYIHIFDKLQKANIGVILVDFVIINSNKEYYSASESGLISLADGYEPLSN